MPLCSATEKVERIEQKMFKNNFVWKIWSNTLTLAKDWYFGTKMCWQLQIADDMSADIPINFKSMF